MRNLANLASVPDPLPESVNLPRDYFVRRGTRMDAAGDLRIHSGSHWGYLVTIIGRGHELVAPPDLGPAIRGTIIVEDGAWICSSSLLYNCHIGRGAIVAAGSVVRSQTVAAGVMVAGNPARVIARWHGLIKGWIYLDEALSGFQRHLL